MTSIAGKSFLTREAGSAAGAVLLAFGTALGGCYTPRGRPFEPAPAPGAEAALVYVYHVSPSRSVLDYGERIFVDGTELGLLHTSFGQVCEYLWTHLAPGPHRILVETNSPLIAHAPKNPVTLELTTESAGVYVVRVETSRNIGMSVGVSAGSGGVQSHSSTYAGAGAKRVDYSQRNVDDPELAALEPSSARSAPWSPCRNDEGKRVNCNAIRDCRIVEPPEVE